MKQSNKEVKEIKKDFEKQFKVDIITVKKGRLSYDYHTLKADLNDIWNFIESTISQTRQEVIEEIKQMDSAVTIQGSLGSKIDVEAFDLIFRKDLLNKLSNKI